VEIVHQPAIMFPRDIRGQTQAICGPLGTRLMDLTIQPPGNHVAHQVREFAGRQEDQYTRITVKGAHRVLMTTHYVRHGTKDSMFLLTTIR